jgi:acyl-CoA synthetase (AMP-forming)/AMP-acid ligase II
LLPGTEVESVFYESAAVVECTAFGVPDARLGEDIAIMVYTEATASVTAEELVKFAKDSGKLAKFKIPLLKNVFFTSEPLPKGATGKIHKQTIRQNVEAMQKQSKL